MSYLVAAIEAEARGDFKGAAENYRHITDAGSPLDRVGIHQALARCLEKQGDVKGAAEWRRKAGMGYLALPDDVMPVDQREYLALVEYRNAVQDVSADVTAARGLAREYGEVLAKNFSEGAKGLTHEGLFAGAFFRALGDHRTATRYYFDTAETLSEEASERGDLALREAAARAYEIAMDCAQKSGNQHVARVAELRAFDLRQPPK